MRTSFILHTKQIEDMIMDMKDGLETHNSIIRKQRIQHYNEGHKSQKKDLKKKL